MPTSSSTAVKQIESAKETILGMTCALEQRFGCTPRNDLATTLNKLFGVYPTTIPTAPKLVKYFCWGVGGRNNDTDGLSSARPVLGTNMCLYGIRPFRAVPFEQDLDAVTRAKYAMRTVRTINNTRYVLYYLKRLDFPQNQVQYIRTDPVNGTTTTYDLDYSNLTPKPPVVSDNCVISDVADSISVVLPASATITGQEVLESMSVVDGGDSRFASVSELGFVSAAEQTMQTVDANGTQFTYQEALMAQMVDQYNWIGQPFMSTSDSFTRSLQFSMRNLINQA